MDPDTLATLPAAELAAGWVEVLKTALIAGGALWERVGVAEGCEVDERTILDCARTKLAVVAADERDGGAPPGAEPRAHRRPRDRDRHRLRALPPRRGGRARAAGRAARCPAQDELRAQVRELLRRRGLPVTLGGARRGRREIVAATARDKKRLGAGGVPFVLLSAPGEPRVGCEVAEGELRAAVRELIA